MYVYKTRAYNNIIIRMYLTYGGEPVIEGGAGKKMNNDPQRSRRRRRRSRSRRRRSPCVVFFCPGHKSRTVRTVSTHRRWRCCCNRDALYIIIKSAHTNTCTI